MDTENLLTTIVSRIMPLNPAKIILFGSHAKGTATSESDIDLLVVLDNEQMPAGYDENMANYLDVSSQIRDLKKKIDIDLIVHTLPMHRKFLALGSRFSEKIKKGRVLYEADHRGVA